MVKNFKKLYSVKNIRFLSVLDKRNREKCNRETCCLVLFRSSLLSQHTLNIIEFFPTKFLYVEPDYHYDRGCYEKRKLEINKAVKFW